MGVLFDADADQITYGDVTTFDGMAAWTISLWAKLDSVANAATGRRWITKWGAGAGAWTFLVSQGDAAGANLQAASSDGGGVSVGTKAALLATGSTWVNYIATFTMSTRECLRTT